MPTPLPGVSFTLKVLAWLDHVEAKRVDAAGLESTQSGIAHATGLSRGHISRTVRPLLSSGCITAARHRIPGFARTLLTYQITRIGRQKLDEMAAALNRGEVETRRLGAGPERMTIRQATDRSSPPLSLWEAMSQIESQGFIDLVARGSTQVGARRFVVDLEEVPSTLSMVGRDPSLRALQKWLDTSGGLYVLEGPGGIGKTTLVARALAPPRPPMHIVWLRVDEWSTTAKLLERLEGFFGALGRPGVFSTEAGPEELLGTLQRRSKGFPILVVVDDVHRADASLRRFLALLARLRRTVPTFKLALVGRSVDLPGEDLRDAFFQRLTPLARMESNEYLAFRGVAEPDRARLAEAAGGVPLFLDILARHPAAASMGIEVGNDVFRGVAEDLPDDERKALRVAAALRNPIDAELLDRLGIGSGSTLSALARAGFLSALADGRFAMHEIVRRSVYDHMPFRDQESLHRRLADAFSSRAADLGDATEYLHHLVRAGRRGEAVRWVLAHRTEILERARQRFTEPSSSARGGEGL